MAASDLSADVFVNFILVILIEIPANFFCVYAMDKFGRKPLLVFSQILAGVSCIAAGLMTEYYAGWLPVSIIWHAYMHSHRLQTKSLFRTRAGSHFHGTEIEIWSGF